MRTICERSFHSLGYCLVNRYYNKMYCVWRDNYGGYGFSPRIRIEYVQADGADSDVLPLWMEMA